MLRHVFMYALLMFAHVNGHHVELPETSSHRSHPAIVHVSR